MADRVTRYLDRTLDELAAYRYLALFSPSEIAALVDRRTAYEYALQRTDAHKPDYVQYLRYELNLDALRRKRRARLPSLERLDPRKQQPIARAAGFRSPLEALRVVDQCGIQRLTFVYERTLRKFDDDLSLWLSYLDFLLERQCFKALARLFPRALALHPHALSLWLACAHWNWRVMADLDSMRVTLQRALRINPHAHSIYVAFFAYEIEYVAKILERRRVLGLNVDASAAARDLREDVSESKHRESDEDEESRESEESKESKESKEAPSSSSSTDSLHDETIFQLMFPRAIFKNSIIRSQNADAKFLFDRRKRRKLAKAAAAQPKVAADASEILDLCASFLACIPDARNPSYRLPSSAPAPSAAQQMMASFYHHNQHTYQHKINFEPLLEDIRATLQQHCSLLPAAVTLLAHHALHSPSPQSALSNAHQLNRVAACATFDRALSQASSAHSPQLAQLQEHYLDFLLLQFDTQPTAQDSKLLQQHFEALCTRMIAEFDTEHPQLFSRVVDAWLQRAHAVSAAACKAQVEKLKALLEQAVTRHPHRSQPWLGLVSAHLFRPANSSSPATSSSHSHHSASSSCSTSSASVASDAVDAIMARACNSLPASELHVFWLLRLRRALLQNAICNEPAQQLSSAPAPASASVASSLAVMKSLFSQALSACLHREELQQLALDWLSELLLSRRISFATYVQDLGLLVLPLSPGSSVHRSLLETLIVVRKAPQLDSHERVKCDSMIHRALDSLLDELAASSASSANSSLQDSLVHMIAFERAHGEYARANRVVAQAGKVLTASEFSRLSVALQELERSA